ncbi:MAG: flagellar motor switch protein FliN [Actinomycetota bacterium]|nr:flagellar motor switch protein FliN [Actinomycetota bacterium]
MSDQMPGEAVPGEAMAGGVPAGLADVVPAGAGVVPAGAGVVPAGAAMAALPAGDGRSIDLLYTVDMAVTVELGRTRMAMRELLALRPGKVIELDRSARAPVDILVNNTLLAHGEVVVVDEELGVRVTEIASSPADRAAG